MTGSSHERVAIVLAAHGDRGGDGGNAHLSGHAETLTEQGRFAGVFYGALNAEPAIESALGEADACAAEQIVVVPLFMSAGYFVKTVLADRIAAASLKTPTGIMQPLGLDRRIALVMLEHALRTTKAAGVTASEAQLVVVGHGSKQGPESADATKRAARLISGHSPYAGVETAFIEEAPFLADVLKQYDGTSVVAGFLSGDGLHAGEDIPEIIKTSGARALYTGPIGLHPRVPELISSAIDRALEEQEGADKPETVEPAQPAVIDKAAATGPRTSETRALEPERPARAAAAPEPEHEEDAGAGLETPPADKAMASTERETGKSKAAARRSVRRRSPLRLLFKAVTVLVMMAILAAVAVPFLVSDDVIREQAVSLLKEKTGRTLTIGGKTSISVFPNIGVEMEDVAISNPPGMAEGETLRMKALNLDLKLLPLLSRKVKIDRFILDKPVFNLVVDAKGRKNWDFQKTAGLPNGKPNTTASAGPRKQARPMAMAQAGGIGGGAVQDISLGTVAITDGTVIYTNETTGESDRINALNVTVVQPELAAPLEADGDVVWKGEKIDFDGRLEDIPALLKDKSSGARFNFTSAHIRGSFDGALAVSPEVAAKGTLKSESPSVRGLSGWLGNPIPPGGGLGPLSIKSDLRMIGETLTFSKAQLSIDGMNGTGEVEVRLKGVRPFVTASLKLDKLDLNPYVEEQGTETRAVAPTAPVPAQPAQTPKPQSGDSLTDFIKKLEKDPDTRPKTQVRAWSQEAVDFSGFRAVDADLKLSADKILIRNIKTGASDVDAKIRSGVLAAKLQRLSLYSGTGTGTVTLNGARAVPGIKANFNLNGISALPLLKDVANFKWVSGRANVALNITGNGRSQTEIMRSLEGGGNFNFVNGAIEGINIPAMVRGLKQGKFDGWKRDDREKTDFSQLTASFTIQQGVAFNRDLNLVGPLLRATGEGTVDIGNERVDYSALPRLVASLEGQGGQVEQGRGIAVPIKIKGPWENARVSVDLERLMNDPELAQNAINEVGKALENNSELNDVLKGLFGGGNQQGQGTGNPGQGQGQQVNPGEILKNLFKKP